MTAVDLDALDAARAAVLTIRQGYPSLPVLQQKGPDVEAVWSDGADMTWIECEEAADAALIVAAVNALPNLTAALRAVLARHYPHGRNIWGDEVCAAGHSVLEPWPCPDYLTVTAALDGKP